MKNDRHNGILYKNIDNRSLSIIVFSLIFAWILSFPFEGQILYSLTEMFQIEPHRMVFGAIISHFAGLFLCGFFVKNIQAAKKTMFLSILLCILGSFVYFSKPGAPWQLTLILISFIAGICVAAWGFFLKKFTPKNERIKTTADVLIYSNIIMIVLDMATVYISAYVGLSLSIAILALALLFVAKLPTVEANTEHQELPNDTKNAVSITKPLLLLYLFIVIITINSGLMYQVMNPAFSHLEWLTSWYWAIPYIVALYIMRNLSRERNRTYILYIGITMIGFSFITFAILDKSWQSYLVVDTLMLGACGIYDLFWWSILGEMLDFDENPAKVFGIGLSANVLGVLLGGVIGNVINGAGRDISTMLLALGVVCVTFTILPLLHKYLSEILSDHAYLTMVLSTPQEKREMAVKNLIELGGLTEREEEIVELLLAGKTYKTIGSELYISENTVKTHVKKIYSKLNIRNRTELINLMLEQHSAMRKESK
ncbi:LuxR C-terminal-related transcriptional regulator [Tepidanaerobacter syntrophicus]|uniref:Regulatory protein, luxR family n=1 Tax=Tepidanaerobacter syntrophicus TaxID=224999 RepID=A0A0U9HBW0_9FIRM|nr:LuxR C-terminal-related transcriptional regulator [Tepidanaerobacter syntrophicus]GAQ24277.1 regulatory protein, luxR family [Tepidanaerobacter syntrophicus]